MDSADRSQRCGGGLSGRAAVGHPHPPCPPPPPKAARLPKTRLAPPLFISTSMPRLRARATHDVSLPTSKPTTDIVQELLPAPEVDEAQAGGERGTCGRGDTSGIACTECAVRRQPLEKVEMLRLHRQAPEPTFRLKLPLNRVRPVMPARQSPRQAGPGGLGARPLRRKPAYAEPALPPRGTTAPYGGRRITGRPTHRPRWGPAAPSRMARLQRGRAFLAPASSLTEVRFCHSARGAHSGPRPKCA